MQTVNRVLVTLTFTVVLALGAASPVTMGGKSLTPHWNTAQAKDDTKEKKAKVEKECSKADKACNDANARRKAEEHMQQGKEMKAGKKKKK